MAKGSLRVEGFEQLVQKLERMGQAGNKIANTALKESAKIVVDEQKKDAPRHSGSPSRGKKQHGYEGLQVGKIRTAKASKNKYVQIGINGKGYDYWDIVAGVYFQHYGYHNHWNGRYYAGSLWMDKSFNKVKDKAAKVMIDHLKKELDF